MNIHRHTRTHTIFNIRYQSSHTRFPISDMNAHNFLHHIWTHTYTLLPIWYVNTHAHTLFYIRYEHTHTHTISNIRYEQKRMPIIACVKHEITYIHTVTFVGHGVGIPYMRCENTHNFFERYRHAQTYTGFSTWHMKTHKHACAQFSTWYMTAISMRYSRNCK